MPTYPNTAYHSGVTFDESYPYDSAGGLVIPDTRHTSSGFPVNHWWTNTELQLSDGQGGQINTFYYQADRIYYSLSSETPSDTRDFKTTLDTYGNIKLFIIDAELFAATYQTIFVSYDIELVGNEPCILNTITFTESQLENFFWKDAYNESTGEYDAFNFDIIIGNKVELPWSPLYNNKYIMLATNAVSFGS